jgi:hypothetical protein
LGTATINAHRVFTSHEWIGDGHFTQLDGASVGDLIAVGHLVNFNTIDQFFSVGTRMKVTQVDSLGDLDTHCDRLNASIIRITDISEVWNALVSIIDRVSFAVAKLSLPFGQMVVLEGGANLPPQVLSH